MHRTDLYRSVQHCTTIISIICRQQEQLRLQVPVALGQALQVPPADVLGEVLLGSMAMSVDAPMISADHI
jgi:hypothetical protein